MEQQILYSLMTQDQGGQAPQQTPGCQGMGGMLFPLVLMFVIIYFLMIRPQQKQQKRHKSMISALKRGDRIITNAGIFGTITGLTESTMTLEVAKNVHIRVLRAQIAGLQPEGGEKSSEGTPVVPGANK